MLQFLKYRVGKWYKHHHDYFHNFRELQLENLRRWTRMRIASLHEFREDWIPDTEEEKLADKILRPAAKRVKEAIIGSPRNRITFADDIRSRDALIFTLMEGGRYIPLPKPILREAFSLLGISKGPFSVQNFEGLAEAQPHQYVFAASRALSKGLAMELGLPQEFSQAFEFDQFSQLDILETEPISSPVKPNRHATVFPYLNNVEEGGETGFPDAENPSEFLGPNFAYPVYKGIPECSKGLLIKPNKGTAPLFYHRLPSGEIDPLSLHTGCPPQKGIKYAINGFTWDRHPEMGLRHFME